MFSAKVNQTRGSRTGVRIWIRKRGNQTLFVQESAVSGEQAQALNEGGRRESGGEFLALTKRKTAG